MTTRPLSEVEAIASMAASLVIGNMTDADDRLTAIAIAFALVSDAVGFNTDGANAALAEVRAFYNEIQPRVN